MQEVHVIRHKVRNEQKSIREVAREMRVSRNTVRKYLRESEPVHHERKPRHKPVEEQIAPRIDALLEEWESQTTPKQRITGTRLLRKLREEGYTCGATTVRAYLAEKRRQKKEVFIPLIHRPGDEAQVDFFEVTVEENGVRKKVWKFVMRLMYAGWDFVWLYDRCDQVSFLDGHVRAFNYYNGVPHRCVYDNLTAAVKRIVLPERELAHRFLALVSHYWFEPCFTRVGEGHDKGGVESRGKTIRLQHFVPIPQGDSLTAISKRVLVELENETSYKRDKTGRSLCEKIEEERRHLRELPEYDFDPSKLVPVSINSLSTVMIEGAQYSVPSEWARLDAIAYVGVDEIRIACRNETVVYPKQRRGEKQICYRYYLKEFSQKPQAVRQVAPELMAELGEPFQRLWTLLEETHGGRDAGRVMAKILKAIHEHSLDVVREGVEQSLAAQPTDFLWLAGLQEETAPKRIDVPVALKEFVVETIPASDFDHLLRGCAHE